MSQLPNLTVKKDYRGYFEQLVRTWYARQAARGITPMRREVIISSSVSPYDHHAVTCLVSNGGSTLSIDFYPARSKADRLSDFEIERYITELL